MTCPAVGILASWSNALTTLAAMHDVDAHRRKYARVERERRFLVATLPSDQPTVRASEVVDHYFDDTRLRLRRMTDLLGSDPVPIFKLTQKIPEDGRGDRGLITNMYLSESEYELLSGLGGRELRKTRYSIPPMGVDVFAPPLDGLILAEVEFLTDDAMEEFAPPNYVAAEVTSDVRFTGGKLVCTTPQELVSLLAEYRG